MEHKGVEGTWAPRLSLYMYMYMYITYFLHLHFNCYSQSHLYPPPTLLPNSPTPTSWPWHSPILGHIIFVGRMASPPIDGWLGHPLLHMQQETWALGLLISSYCCSSYRAADLFSSLGAFSISSIGGHVFHPIDSEHPLLYLPYTGIASQEISILGTCKQNLVGICISV
jgi:hypothetical protein